MDADFACFVDDLPRPLSDLGRRQETYSGQPGSEQFAGICKLNPVIVGAPWLFWDLFESLPYEQLLTIAEAGGYLGIAYIIVDHLVDDQVAEPALVSLLSQAFYERALILFRDLFEPAASFWSHLDRLWAELRCALAGEWLSLRQPGPISQEEFRLWAEAKSVPIIITFAALAQAAGRLSLLEIAEASMKEGGAAAQLDHDVGDWLKDIGGRHMTYFLGQVMAAGDLGSEWPTESQFAAVVDARWLDAEYFKLALTWFEQARDLGQGLSCPSWTRFLGKCQERVQYNLDRQLLRHIVRVSENALR